MPIADKIRYVNKRFTNRMMIHLAGKAHSPIALLTHFGRKSGKAYPIPIMVAPSEDGFVFALTYGSGVDWYKNVQAANRAELRWQGKEFALSAPSQLNPDAGRACFGRLKGRILRMVGVDEFVKMAAVKKSEEI